MDEYASSHLRVSQLAFSPQQNYYGASAWHIQGTDDEWSLVGRGQEKYM